MIDWNETYIKYNPQVRKVCSSILGWKHPMLDDAISETFEKGINKQDIYDPSISAINTWLCNIAKNVCLMILKGDRRKAPILIDFPDDVEQDEIDIDSMHEKILEIIESMPETRNKKTYVAVLNGMSHEQAAEFFGIETVSVRVRIMRFLDKLREITDKDPAFEILNRGENRMKKFGWSSNKINKNIEKRREQKLKTYLK